MFIAFNIKKQTIIFSENIFVIIDKGCPYYGHPLCHT